MNEESNLYSLFLQAGQDMKNFYTLPTEQRQQILDHIEELNAMYKKDNRPSKPI